LGFFAPRTFFSFLFLSFETKKVATYRYPSIHPSQIKPPTNQPTNAFPDRYQRNGSLVVATTPEEMAALPELLDRGHTNGIAGLRIVGAAELRELEPHVHPDALGALWSPHTGTVTPYEFTIAVAENAAANGVEFRVHTKVTGITGEKGHFSLETESTRPPPVAETDMGPAGAPCLCPFAFPASVVAAAVGAGAAAAGGAAHFGGAAWEPSMLLALAGAVSAVVLLVLGYVARLLCNAAAGATPGSGQAAAATAKHTHTHKHKHKPAEQSRHGGSSQDAAGEIDGESPAKRIVRARFIVNAAGLGSDKVSALVGDTSFTIKPRTGDYFLLHKNQGHLVRRVLFPTPSALGKGILIQPTLWGNVLLGPTARDRHDPAMAAQTPAAIAAEIVGKCRKLIPGFDAGMVIHSFAGDRAKSTRGDWVIEESAVMPGFVQAAGIDSPGLASSPAIAQHVVGTLLRSIACP
jgi:L-2-hydroxyglutarate oxidase LhgO